MVEHRSGPTPDLSPGSSHLPLRRCAGFNPYLQRGNDPSLLSGQEMEPRPPRAQITAKGNQTDLGWGGEGKGHRERETGRGARTVSCCHRNLRLPPPSPGPSAGCPDLTQHYSQYLILLRKRLTLNHASHRVPPPTWSSSPRSPPPGGRCRVLGRGSGLHSPLALLGGPGRKSNPFHHQ